ncbi:HDIG domain-containing metalloprotein [Clostridium polynesiense]|uniref:HDIG domain-containing metalloprotein n=1 Tax=Clostridium polynesiense TaxID=1325933 RepID=UPI00058E5F20|nr:HDIG domain-containing metalloprotein [Clostridium polynesiense]
MDKKEIFMEIEKHLLEDERPSLFLKRFLENNKIDINPYNMITDLKEIPQEPKHHPEGSVFNHIMMVVDEAAKKRKLSKNMRVLMWSSLLHDIGKTPTTKKRKGRWTSYDHDKVGEKMVMEFFQELGFENKDLALKISKMARWHMQALFVIKSLPFADIETMIEEVEVEELALLTVSDRLGRGKLTESQRKQVIDDINKFLIKVSEVSGEKYSKINY